MTCTCNSILYNFFIDCLLFVYLSSALTLIGLAGATIFTFTGTCNKYINFSSHSISNKAFQNSFKHNNN